MLYQTIFLATCLLAYYFAPSQTPTVQIGATLFIGTRNSGVGVDSFRGIRYGNSERFRRATLETYGHEEQYNATWFGVSCAQVLGNNALAVNYNIYGTDENCNVLDIYRPSSVSPSKKLPVMFWIHGGAFVAGAASHYSGEGIVQQSTEMGLPVIVVSINYRLASYGFLGGKEMKRNGALNLGLYDQRLAMQWVQKYISAFGGDKTKVTIFGQSSGAMSVSYHYLTPDTALFRGAIIQSGALSSSPVNPPEYYQNVYNGLVELTGCKTSSDTFDCLRTAPFERFSNASVMLLGQPTVYSRRPYWVTVDGDIIPDTPYKLLAQKKIAPIPFITGTVLDEGTVFVAPIPNDTDTDWLKYLKIDYAQPSSTFFGNGALVSKLEELYPNDPLQGSPYNTPRTAFLGPQFKRAAAAYGDIHFLSPRRAWVDAAVEAGIDCWSYSFETAPPNARPWQGVFHTADIPFVFRKFDASLPDLHALSTTTASYWIAFANSLNPNFESNVIWDQYGKDRNILRLKTRQVEMIKDVFRQSQMDFIQQHSERFL